MCMRKIFSFKCPTILKPNIGWRHEFNSVGVFTIILVLLLILAAWLSLFALPFVILLYIVVQKIWQFADHLFIFKKDDLKEKIKVLIYNDDNGDEFGYKYKVRIQIGKELSDFLFVEDYEWIKLSNNKGFFIYSIKGVWYYFDGDKVFLGERTGKLVFVDKTNTYRINMLGYDGVLVRFARKVFYGKKLNIPELDEFDRKDRDYLLIKNSNKYHLLSAAYQQCNDGGLVFTSEERFKSAIFVEDGKTVVLIWDEKLNGFKEIYRKKNPIDSLEMIIEVKKGNSNSKFIDKGVIYRFNVRTKALKPIYQGRIFNVDTKTRRVFIGSGVPYTY